MILRIPGLIHLHQAKELFVKDVNYIVRDGEIIVDEFTGRVMPGNWSDGQHQAIEAKVFTNQAETNVGLYYLSKFLPVISASRGDDGHRQN